MLESLEEWHAHADHRRNSDCGYRCNSRINERFASVYRGLFDLGGLGVRSLGQRQLGGTLILDGPEDKHPKEAAEGDHHEPDQEFQCRAIHLGKAVDAGVGQEAGSG